LKIVHAWSRIGVSFKNIPEGGGVSQCISNGKHVRGGTCEERIKRKYKGKIYAELRGKIKGKGCVRRIEYQHIARTGKCHLRAA
jgi:hypothetical protein